MNTRRFAIGFLALCACSRKSEDAGIVLNIDAEVSADRTVINHITITVDGEPKEWTLTRALPGSLGIVTSPGRKSVTVEGFANTVLRGLWTGSVVAIKGSVVVQDVHLAYVSAGVADGGAPFVDGGLGEPLRADGAVDVGTSPPDAAGESGGAGGISGKGGTSGTTSPALDGGAGGIAGTGGTGGGAGGSARSDGGTAGADGGSTRTDAGSAGTDSGPGTSSPDASDGPLLGDDGAPMPAPLTGAFSVSSQFDISATAAAPGPVKDTLGLVHEFVDDPGAAILNFAEQAGNPGLATLRAVLPSALESQLAGWMNSYIETANVNGIVPYDRLVWLDSTVRALLLYWGLASKLALPINGSGTHSPVTLVFASPSGTSYPVPIDPAAQVTSGTGVSALASWPGGTGGSAMVTISDHVMAFPFGRYALQALDAILLAEYGTPDVGAYLSDSIGCPGMAGYVASQCISILCVGHAAELTDVCESGLAEGGRQIENQMTAIDFQAVRFQQGTATAIGAQVIGPQNATALQSGVWSVTVDFGNGPEPADATFTASAEAGSG